jgi:hypothetical protein
MSVLWVWRIPMDQSRQTQLTRQAYGSSDNTRPSFNWPEYARHVSITEPRDLGVLHGRRLVQEGFIGAESGGQTLFLQFQLERRARIRLRLTSTNAYTIQYITASVRGLGGDVINPLIGQAEVPREINAVTFYVEPLYWGEGYSQVEIGPGLSPSSEEDLDGGNASSSISASNFEPLDPGTYVVAISSSQWPQLPYRLEIVGYSDAPLSAVCDVTVDLAGRMGFTNLSALADMEVYAEAAVTREANLAAVTGFSVSPAGRVTRIPITS